MGFEMDTEKQDLLKKMEAKELKLKQEMEKQDKKNRIGYQRNMEAKAYLKNGDTEKAIELLELNISDRFQGNFPFDRLVSIYKKQEKNNEVIRVLEVAVDVFTNDVYSGRSDRDPKLNKFKKSLAAAKEKL